MPFCAPSSCMGGAVSDVYIDFVTIAIVYHSSFVTRHSSFVCHHASVEVGRAMGIGGRTNTSMPLGASTTMRTALPRPPRPPWPSSAAECVLLASYAICIQPGMPEIATSARTPPFFPALIAAFFAIRIPPRISTEWLPNPFSGSFNGRSPWSIPLSASVEKDDAESSRISGPKNVRDVPSGQSTT